MVEGQPKGRTGKLGYLEIPAVDAARSAEFYRQAFGWVIRTRGDGSVCFDDTANEVTGTFVTGPAAALESGLRVYITVADMRAALAAVRRAGGAVQDLRLSATDDTLATFRDPGDNLLGLYQHGALTPPDEPAEPSNAEPSAEPSPAEPSADLDRMLDLATPWCLRVAATLRIPEHIAAGHTDIAALAAAAECDQDALHAVLGHLVSQDVFSEESPGRFSANHVSDHGIER